MKLFTKAIFTTVLLIIIIYLLEKYTLVDVYFENFAKWLYPKEENRNAELFKIILTIIGGLGVLFGLYLNYLRAKISDKEVQLQSKSIKHQADQIELSIKSQIDERFKNAVEHLGSDKEPVILGGIAELDQIARENPQKYSSVVFNILTAYIRTSARKRLKLGYSSTVIQTIISFLFKKENNSTYANLEADFSHCDFTGLDLSYSVFNLCDFRFCKMPSSIKNSSFFGSRFGRTEFNLSTLDNCDLRSIEFHDDFFQMCTINNCDFTNSRMMNQLFTITKFNDCKFNSVALSNCNFIMCNLDICDFKNSNILTNSFLGCNLINVDFSENETFSNNDFRGSGFRDCSFPFISFQSNFSGIGKNFQFSFIQPEDILARVSSEAVNVSEFIPGFRFNETILNPFTIEDYNYIKSQYENAGENFRKRYETKKTPVFSTNEHYKISPNVHYSLANLDKESNLNGT